MVRVRVLGFFVDPGVLEFGVASLECEWIACLDRFEEIAVQVNCECF